MAKSSNKKYQHSIKYRFFLGLALIFTLVAIVVHVISLLSGGKVSLILIVVVFFVFTYWSTSRHDIAEVTQNYLVISSKRKIAWKDIKKVKINRSFLTTTIRIFYQEKAAKKEEGSRQPDRERFVVLQMVDRVDQLIADINKNVPKSVLANRSKPAARK